MKSLPRIVQQGLLWRLLVTCAGLAAALALALAIGAVLVVTRDPPPALAPSPDTLAAVAIYLPEAPPNPGAGDMLARPLFWQSRTPLEELAVEDAPAPARTSRVLEDTRLLGLFSSGGRSGIILAVGKERRRLMQGEALDGWTFDSLDGTTAVFTDDSGTARPTRLPLEHAGVAAPVEDQETDDDQGEK